MSGSWLLLAAAGAGWAGWSAPQPRSALPGVPPGRNQLLRRAGPRRRLRLVFGTALPGAGAPRPGADGPAADGPAAQEGAGVGWAGLLAAATPALAWWLLPWPGGWPPGSHQPLARWLVALLRTGGGAAIFTLARRGLARLPRRADLVADRGQRRLVPLVLDLLALGLRAGLPAGRCADQVAQALAERDPAAAGPDAHARTSLGGALYRVAQHLQAGDPAALAWRELAVTPLAFVAGLMARGAEQGGSVVRELEQLADTARHELAASGLAAARSSGVRAVLPLGLCFLPAFLLLAVAPVVVGAIAQLRF